MNDIKIDISQYTDELQNVNYSMCIEDFESYCVKNCVGYTVLSDYKKIEVLSQYLNKYEESDWRDIFIIICEEYQLILEKIVKFIPSRLRDVIINNVNRQSYKKRTKKIFNASQSIEDFMVYCDDASVLFSELVDYKKAEFLSQYLNCCDESDWRDIFIKICDEYQIKSKRVLKYMPPRLRDVINYDPTKIVDNIKTTENVLNL